ncbi:hypothetical protein [Serratia ficaria]|uniref:hypothetical protein n=1 Tax=Serratia ficaria TaxID=61651 RepID=UPI00077CBB29|nr:hypothetical protein [Serratia ficaria]
MTTMIRNLDMEIKNPSLTPIYEPFASVPGLMQGIRVGEGLVDLSGNGYTVTPIGTPTLTKYSVIGDKNNGFMTNVPDGLQRTIIAVYKQSADVATFGYPVSNITQQTSAQGVGMAITDVSSTSLRRRSLNVGAKEYNETLYGVASGPSEGVVTRNKFVWTAVTVDGAGNTAGLFVPAANPAIIPATLAEGANLAERTITEGGGDSYYRVIAWRSPTIPPVASASGLEVAEWLIYDRALSLSDLQVQYGRSQRYFKNLLNEQI